ncbi:PucR family transcriptional regulator ligand-binding domain-containing protein [Actinomadura sp. 1N219]|uniref:PucR family transcriptional regulator ligand-binding domain-containing protein n=1 Tax=Actinomadura sp. 1N219 TaxID=3375152 RepID=UPI0037B42D7F
MVPLRLFVNRLSLRPLGATDPSGRWVRWVHVSELADPSPFLRGGELLLLAGTGFRPGESGEYVRRLADAGVEAIGFGVTPVFDAVPPELVAACDEHGMALLEVPPHVPFASIVELLHAELVRAETRDLKHLSDGQAVLIKAAAGPGPLRAVVERLAELLGGWVLVVDRNRDRTWSAGPVRRDAEVTAALERACASPSPMSAALATADEHVEIQRLLGPAPTGYAMAVARRGPFSVADRGVVGVAASALSLLFTAPSAAGSPEALGAAAVAGLLRLPTLARALAGPLDLGGDASWRVVRGLLTEPPGSRETIIQRLSAAGCSARRSWSRTATPSSRSSPAAIRSTSCAGSWTRPVISPGSAVRTPPMISIPRGARRVPRSTGRASAARAWSPGPTRTA